MKLEFPETVVTTSTKFETQKFDFGDVALIMEILRGKMYSVPIRTICREIMCNARDAHREVGTPQRPIEVTLPTISQRDYKVRDFGPGITPSRMGEVFIKYAASTKRDSNDQTGGFGLGAKSPFSYTDTFSVVSITPEDGKMTLREYVAYIDETRIGTMSLVKEEPTNEKQGTTVIVPCKPDDESSFRSYSKEAAEWWAVKPTILPDAGTFVWPTHKPTYTGDGWETYSQNTSQSAVVVDGIPFPLDDDIIFTGELESFQNTVVVIHVDVGDVKVTANREQIDYQPEVICRLKEIMGGAKIAINRVANKLLGSCKTLPEAYKVWLKVKHDIPASVVWEGVNLGNATTLKAISRGRLQCVIFNRYNSGGKHEVIRKENAGSWSNTYNLPYNFLSKQFVFAVDDTGNTHWSRKRILKLFERDPKLQTAVIVRDVVPEAKLLLESKWHWSKMSPIMLSSIKFAPAGRSGKPVPVKEMYVVNNNATKWVKTDISLDDDSVRRTYVLLKAQKAIVNGEAVEPKEMRRIAERLRGMSIYGILASKMPKAGLGDHWVNIEAAIQTEIDNILLKNKVKTIDFYNDLDISHTLGRELAQIIRDNLKEFDSSSPLVRFAAFKSKRVPYNIHETVRWLWNTIGVKDPIKNIHRAEIEALTEAVNKRYPLLKLLAIDFRDAGKEAVIDIVEYIKTKDREASSNAP